MMGKQICWQKIPGSQECLMHNRNADNLVGKLVMQIVAKKTPEEPTM
jgi:hypothetical protein